MKAFESRLVELISNMLSRRLVDLHTATPGQIVKFYPDLMAADVRVLINRATRSGIEEQVEIIPEVPVILPRAASTQMFVPLDPGDLVLLVFCERSLDDFKLVDFSSGKKELSPPPIPRFHDYADAVAIPAVSSQKMQLGFFDAKHRQKTNYFIAHKGAIFAMDGGGKAFLGKESDSLSARQKMVMGENLGDMLEEVINEFDGFLAELKTGPLVDTGTGSLLPPKVKAIELIQGKLSAIKTKYLETQTTSIYSEAAFIGKGI